MVYVSSNEKKNIVGEYDDYFTMLTLCINGIVILMNQHHTIIKMIYNYHNIKYSYYYWCLKRKD